MMKLEDKALLEDYKEKLPFALLGIGEVESPAPGQMLIHTQFKEDSIVMFFDKSIWELRVKDKQVVWSRPEEFEHEQTK